MINNFRGFQVAAHRWIVTAFGLRIANDKAERSHRFIEEALELGQACECTKEQAHQLVDYVFGRPVGEREQEVGGVMVTLSLLCNAYGINMARAGNTELDRANTPEVMEKIRAKQKAKPKFGPLPQ
jgi:NTP pyrophosphatase (non-canonical NTP hydrolase)